MLIYGVALIGFGLYWLLWTRGACKSEEEVQQSLRHEKQNRRTWGILAGGVNNIEWTRRATYKHPVLMSLTWIVPLLVGPTLVVVDLST